MRAPGTLVVAACIAASAGRGAEAKGRFPMTMSVAFQPGDDRKIWIGTTFGLLHSPDDGATWQWVCEPVLGYTGIYDPVLAITSAGTLFHTMTDGLRWSRDGCDYGLYGPPFDGSRVGDVQVGGDDAVWVAMQGTVTDNDVWVSRNDGVSFAPTGLAVPGASWTSLRVAPSDPLRVYAGGHQNGLALLYRSDDGAATPWTELPFPLEVAGNVVAFLGVSRADPGVVFVRANATDGVVLRSGDAGLTWMEVARFPRADVMAFVTSADGMDVLVGAGPDGVLESHDGGLTFVDSPGSPRMRCAGVRAADGDVFACGENWEPDFEALARSTDLASWSQVMRFSTIQAVLPCAAGTSVAEQCSILWCNQCRMFGCPDPLCGPPPDGPPVMTTTDGGCGCRAGGAGAGGGMAGFAVLLLGALSRLRQSDALSGRAARAMSRLCGLGGKRLWRRSRRS